MIEQSMNRHGAYKDSGVDWLGEVPSEWRVAKVKSTCSHLRDGTHGSFERVDDGYPLLSVRNIVSSKFVLLNDDSCISEHDYKSISKSLKIKEGDLQLAIVGATLGKVALVPENMPKFVTQRSLATLRSIAKILDNKFLFYFAGNSYFQDTLWSKANYSAQPGIYLYTISNIDILLPPIAEQTAIAAYLDEKTAQLDRKIELLGQKATQYGKLKQSLINETVARGLNKTVAMKDSGVEWIGEVPVHWEVQRIGTAFEERSEKVNDTDYPPLSVSMGGIVPQMESVAKTDNNENRKRVAVGDYVINSRSDRRGASGISIYDGSVSVISIVLAPKRSFFGKYLHHLFRSYSFIEEFYRVGRGIVDDLWTTRYSVMKGIGFAYPSYEEQKVIANFIDSKTAHIDRIVATINTQIDKLKELRKTLINDIVTGKIKVA